jgi:methionyl-tRNA formyltransferase
VGAETIRITAQGGQIEIAKVKPEEGKKVAAAEWAKSAGVGPGTILGT